MEAINERFKGGSIADSCSQLYLRPLCIPKMHQGGVFVLQGRRLF